MLAEPERVDSIIFHTVSATKILEVILAKFGPELRLQRVRETKHSQESAVADSFHSFNGLFLRWGCHFVIRRFSILSNPTPRAITWTASMPFVSFYFFVLEYLFYKSRVTVDPIKDKTLSLKIYIVQSKYGPK